MKKEGIRVIYNLDNTVKAVRFGHVPQKQGAWHNTWKQENNTVLYCTDGEIHMMMDEFVYHLETGDALLIPYGAEYEPLEGGACRSYFITFDAEILPDETKISTYISAIPHPWLTEGYAYNCVGDCTAAVKVDRFYKNAPYRMKSIFEEASKLKPNQSFIDYLCLNNLVRDLLICMGNANQRNSNKKFSEILRYIDSHYSEPLSLSDLARQVSLSPSHIAHLFRMELGCTSSEYVNKIRISAAKTLLTETDMTVSEIADRIGYSDVYYFSKIFKRITGTAPSKYRK